MALNQLPSFSLLQQLAHVRDETVFPQMVALCALAEAAYEGVQRPELEPGAGMFDSVKAAAVAAGWHVATRNQRDQYNGWRRTLRLSAPPDTAPQPMEAAAWAVAHNGAVAWIGPAAYAWLLGVNASDVERPFVRNTLRFWRYFYGNTGPLRQLRIMLVGETSDFIAFAKRCRAVGYEVTLDPAYGELRIVN